MIADLIPEAAGLEIRRYELPNLLALNFVIVGYLGEGVAAEHRLRPPGQRPRRVPSQPNLAAADLNVRGHGSRR